MLYEKLYLLVLRNGDFILQSGEVINNQLSGWFKHHRQQKSTLREAQSLRDESRARYEAQSAALLR
jgi:hypothetical protein